jgi:CBS domain containing-hemolysin-like protein
LNLWFWSALIVTCLALFFALTHFALGNFSRARLEEALKRRGRLPQLQRLFRHHEELSRTMGLLHVISLVALAVLTLAWATGHIGDDWLGWTVGILLASVGSLVFGGVVPMAWARYAADGVLASTLPLCHLCRMAFSPLGRILRPLDAIVRRLAGVPDGHRSPRSPIDEEIRSVLAEGEREGVLGKSQKEMMEAVIRFNDTDAGRIMTPRTDIVSIEAGATVDEARALIASSGHSRIPVTKGNIDTIVGILYAKDLLERGCGTGSEQVRVRDVMRQPLFVPETKQLDELLQGFQGDKVHMMIVLDEYGGTAGLVTIEDVVEEIVGEIVDEYEQAPPKPIRPVAERAWEVEARVPVGEVNRDLAIAIPEHEDYETVGGFVLARLGYIPKQGEAIEHEGVRITVLEAEERRILKLRIDLPAPEQPPAQA